MKSGKRSFTINNITKVDGCPTKFSHHDYTGRYEKRNPVQAAKNALSELCRLKKIHGQCTLYIEMRETTQNSKHKVFAYHVKRVKLDKPKDIGDREYHYVNVAKSVDKLPTKSCKSSRKSSGPMKSRKHSKSRSK